MIKVHHLKILSCDAQAVLFNIACILLDRIWQHCHNHRILVSFYAFFAMTLIITTIIMSILIGDNRNDHSIAMDIHDHRNKMRIKNENVTSNHAKLSGKKMNK